MAVSEPEDREGRQAFRRKWVTPASISFQNGNCSMDCIVLDWSVYGARIWPSDVDACPDKFTLTTRDGDRFDCVVVWRHDERIGVKFFQLDRSRAS